jgi:soluble lytic murein transglycosylase
MATRVERACARQRDLVAARRGFVAGRRGFVAARWRSSATRLGFAGLLLVSCVTLIVPGAVRADPEAESEPDGAATAETPSETTPDPFGALDVDPASGLRLARVALDMGETDRALQHLAQLEPTAIGDHAGFLRGRLLLEQGDPLGAQQAFDSALGREPPSELRAEIEAALGRVALQSSDVALAYQHFASAWKTSRDRERSARLALEIARAIEKGRLPGIALELYRTIWRSWPRSEASAAAYERSRWLERATGAEPVDAGVLIDYAERLAKGFRCGQALPLFEEALTREGLGAAASARSRRGRADCLMARRRYDEAAEAYTALLAEKPKDTNLAIALARARGRGGDRPRAARELLAIARRSGGHVRARTRYLAALYLDDIDPKQSLQLMHQVESQKGARGYARMARWRLAWADVRGRRYRSAEKRLQLLAKGSLSDIEVQRARYWLGKSRLGQGRDASGHKILEEIAREVPLSYYGFLCAEIVGPAHTNSGSVGVRDDAVRDAPADRARWLVEGGFPEQASLELLSRVRSGTLGREQRLEISRLLHEVGDHYRAVRVVVDGFGDKLEEGIDSRWRDAWELAWPRPFRDRVDAAVSEFEGDPNLVYAVMREESRFRPRVESPVGARGLMQIIPPTGTRIARDLGQEEFDPDLLFVADTNVRFGTYYLEHLLERFAGTRPFAIAAYNAGPEAVGRWIKRDGDVPLDIFVDSVPYGETRRYLRKVLRSFHLYHLLYDSPEPAPVALPAQPETAKLR